MDNKTLKLPAEIKNNRAVDETYSMCEWHSKRDVMPILYKLHWELTQAHNEQKRLEDIINEQTRFQRFSIWMQKNWKWLGGIPITIATVYKIITFAT